MFPWLGGRCCRMPLQIRRWNSSLMAVSFFVGENTQISIKLCLTSGISVL
jgi:hypothetical protein